MRADEVSRNLERHLRDCTAKSGKMWDELKSLGKAVEALKLDQQRTRWMLWSGFLIIVGLVGSDHPIGRALLSLAAP